MTGDAGVWWVIIAVSLAGGFGVMLLFEVVGMVWAGRRRFARGSELRSERWRR